MTNNGTARKHRTRKPEPQEHSGGVDDETLADYVLGNLAEDQRQELDRKRRLDPDLDAEIEILSRSMGERGAREGPREEEGSTSQADRGQRRSTYAGVGNAPALVLLLPVAGPTGRGASSAAATRYSECIKRAINDGGLTARVGPLGGNSPDRVPLEAAVEAPVLLTEVSSASSETWLVLGRRASMANKITAVAFEASKRPQLLEQAGGIDAEFPYVPSDEGMDQLFRNVILYISDKIDAIVSDETPNEPVAEPPVSGEGRPELAKFRAMLQTAMDEAEQDLIPRRVITKAFTVVKDEDLKKFLELVRQFTDADVFKPSDKDYSNLYSLANMIQAGRNVVEGILHIGLEEHPESELLMRDRIRFLAHSSVAADRKLAKEIVRSKYGSGDSDFQLRNSVSLADIDVYVLALMLDAYHRDGQHEEVVQITTRLVEQNPKSSAALRNHARAMQRLPGRYTKDQVLAEYKKAILVDNAEDLAATWYANALDTFGRQVDALEARVFACMLDLDDADSFASLALSISELVQPRNMVRAKRVLRQMPQGVMADTAVQAIVHADQCKDYGIDAKKMCQAAMLNIGMGVGDIDEEEARLGGNLSRKDRAAFVEKLYELVRSEVTQ